MPVAPCDYLVFGGTGDLALRKLLPALYHRDRDGQITSPSRIVALSRSALGRPDFARMIGEAFRRDLAPAELDGEALERFLGRLDHIQLDALGDQGWSDLSAVLRGHEGRVRMFYLSTSPDLFGPICERLQAIGAVTDQSRVVVEKPIGRDLASSRRINDAIGSVFGENQVFRIDHYLGKETVQNLLALRFGNFLFEPLWDSRAIDHVQISVGETLGVGSRGGYYDGSGALRDMVQNHLLQLLCLVAMEAPIRFDKDAVRDEKLKVLRALRPIGQAEVATRTVRGQYRSGAIGKESVRSYADEEGIPPGSGTETFVALKAEVLNWRWAGVPFYLRTGKRLQEKVSEVVIQFKPVPHSIFGAEAGEMGANRLVIRLQPDESIRLHLMTKDPGPGGMRLREASLNLSFAEAFRSRFPDAYERLLMDVVRGNGTLFMRRDEVEAAWVWTEGILQAWASREEPPKPYTAGTWGPSQSIALIERDGRTWHEGIGCGPGSPD
jgi:glucose-6-phosphate 1-dehydrogenase